MLGTRFNVRRLDDDVRVTLERGRVEVGTSATAQAPVVLLPGQQVDAIGGQLMPLAKVDAATAMAWKDDRLVFERTPLGEAVALLRHYRKAPILLDDPSLASLRLTGVFAAHNVDRLLDLLPSILPVAVSRQEDGSVEINANRLENNSRTQVGFPRAMAAIQEKPTCIGNRDVHFSSAVATCVLHCSPAACSWRCRPRARKSSTWICPPRRSARRSTPSRNNPRYRSFSPAISAPAARRPR